jgi:hypothetical protein
MVVMTVVDKGKSKVLKDMQECLLKKVTVSSLGQPLAERIIVRQIYEIDLEEEEL